MDDILMPRITETMRDGVLLRWLAPDGAAVAEGELIAEVAVEDRVEALESPAAGELLHGVAEGTEVGVGEAIGMVGAPAGPVQMGMFTAQAAPGHDGPPVSTPARRAAEELGVDLSTVAGTGPGGRISRADVEAAAARLGAPAPPPPAAPQPESEPEPEAEPEPEPEPEAEAEPEPEAEPLTADEPHPGVPGGDVATDGPDPGDEPRPAPPALTIVPPIPEPDPAPDPPPDPAPGPATGPVPVLDRDVDVTELLRLRDALAAAAEGGGPGLDALVVRAIALAGDASAVAVRTGGAGPVVVPGADELSVGAIAAAILDGDEGAAPVTLLDLSAGGADRVVPPPGDGTVIAMGRVQRRPVVREHSVMPGRVVTLTLSPGPGTGWEGAAALLDRVASLLECPHALVL